MENEKEIKEAVETAKTDSLEMERNRVDSITSVMDSYGDNAEVKTLGRSAIKKGITQEDFNMSVLDVLAKTGNVNTASREDSPRVESIGMPAKEAREYSITRAISMSLEGKPLDGLEGEVQEQMEKKYGRAERAGSIRIPLEVFERDQTTTPGSAGGYLVQSETQDFITLLRNKAKVVSLGAKMLTNVKGDLVLPKQTGASTVTYLGEVATTPESNLTFGQIVSRPKHARAKVQVSKTLLNQSTPSIEQLVRDDLMAEIALAMDLKALNGAGGQEPLGILNNPDVATTTTATIATNGWSKMVAFETTTATANAIEPYAFLTTAAIRGTLKTTEKASSTGQFIWQSDNTVNGYNAEISNQMPAANTIFGNWSDILMPLWYLEVETHKGPDYDTGLVDILGFLAHDVIVRRPESFVISTDFS